MNIEIVVNRSGVFGGLKRLYRLATYFIQEGHHAVINIVDGSTNTWFEHKIPENVDISPDIRIMPETWQKPHPTAKNILYVQAQFDPPENQFDGIVTTTDYLAECIEKEDFKVDWIVPYGFDTTVFFDEPKRRVKGRIAYMPRKNRQEAELIKIFAPSYDYLAIDGLNETETAGALRSSDIFLALSRCEGFGLPPLEAALCGCLVVGHHGQGGKRWLTPEHAVIADFPQDVAFDLLPKALDGKFEKQRKALRQYTLENLTMEKEKTTWLNIINVATETE